MVYEMDNVFIKTYQDGPEYFINRIGLIDENGDFIKKPDEKINIDDEFILNLVNGNKITYNADDKAKDTYADCKKLNIFKFDNDEGKNIKLKKDYIITPCEKIVYHNIIGETKNDYITSNKNKIDTIITELKKDNINVKIFFQKCVNTYISYGYGAKIQLSKDPKNDEIINAIKNHYETNPETDLMIKLGNKQFCLYVQKIDNDTAANVSKSSEPVILETSALEEPTEPRLNRQPTYAVGTADLLGNMSQSARYTGPGGGRKTKRRKTMKKRRKTRSRKIMKRSRKTRKTRRRTN